MFGVTSSPSDEELSCLILVDRRKDRDVPKTMILAKDLELLALREVRSFPSGEFVARIELERSDPDWALVAIARDGADLDRIQYAVTTTTNRLKERYMVRFDW
jgi:hypothetical protein